MYDILIVDDDPDLRFLLKSALGGKRYNIQEANCIQEASQKMNTQRFDLVVVDGQLPDGSGVDFCQDLKKYDAKLSIIFLSAYYHEIEVFIKLIEKISIDYIFHKPFSPLGVTRYIHALLEQKHHNLAVFRKVINKCRTFTISLSKRLEHIQALLVHLGDKNFSQAAAARIMIMLKIIVQNAYQEGYLRVGSLSEQWQELLAQIQEKQRVANQQECIRMEELFQKIKVASQKLPALEGFDTGSEYEL